MTEMLENIMASIGSQVEDQDWERAKVICNFAEKIQDEFFELLDLGKEDVSFDSNQMVCVLGEQYDDDLPERMYELQLGTCDPLLRPQNREEMFMIDVDVAFCKSRALYKITHTYHESWRDLPGSDKYPSTWIPITYDQAANLVVMHLLEQMLRVAKVHPSGAKVNGLIEKMGQLTY